MNCLLCKVPLIDNLCPLCERGRLYSNVGTFRRSQEDWDAFFLKMATLVATRSKDPDRQVGALVVTADRRQLSMGYNGLPSDVPDDPSLLGDREKKLRLVVHAEENALNQAPFELNGSTLYTTRFPCLPCAEYIARLGVARVVAPKPDLSHPRWGDSWKAGWVHMLKHSTKVVTT